MKKTLLNDEYLIDHYLQKCLILFNIIHLLVLITT